MGETPIIITLLLANYSNARAANSIYNYRLSDIHRHVVHGYYAPSLISLWLQVFLTCTYHLFLLYFFGMSKPRLVSWTLDPLLLYAAEDGLAKVNL